ncbi:MAG: DUF3857 domain-containing protein [Planctomycetota bacterium]|jgi:hypothetical protein
MRTAACSPSQRRAPGIVASFAWVVALAVPVHGRDLPPRISQADFPNQDAVVLRHLQRWLLRSDGGMIYEEHRWVQLLNDRAWRRCSDPRVDYLEGFEEVELLAANAHLPDGSVIEIPDYSTNLVSPRGISTWPALSGWRQVVFTFSGVQNGAVLELHYKRTSKPGVRRWLEADLRVGDLDPVIERIVEVNLPVGQKLHHRLDRLDKQASFAHGTTNGHAMYRWTIKGIASDADEPACPPWRERCGRLRFTNCPSGREWVSDLLHAVESSAKELKLDRIKEFAEQAAEDEVDDTGKIRAIAKKVRDTFNFVDDWRGWTGRRVRGAAEVFDSCYGSRLEGAALTLAAVRSVGLEATPRVAVVRDTFSPEVPTDSALSAVAIEVTTGGGPIRLAPSTGVINPNGPWRDRDLLLVDSGELEQFAAFASESSRPDAVQVRGQLALGEDAEELTGSLNIELTGLFINPEKLRSDDQKRSLLESIIAGLVPDLKLTDFSVSHLSEDRFVAQASVEAKEPPAEVYDRRLLMIAVDTPVLAEAHLPLDRSLRRTPIRLPGHLTEDLRLRIELPDDWKPVILPRPLEAANGKWGRISQTIESDDDAVRLVRQVSFNVLTIEPDDFATVREAVRTLRSEACRSLLIERSEPKQTGDTDGAKD